MKILEKSLVFALVFGIVFSFMSCSSESDKNGSDSISVELPGIPGGSSNSDDLFAGKTFTISTKDDSNKYSENYIFGLDGTVEYNSKRREGSDEEQIEYKYSFVKSGNDLYMYLQIYKTDYIGEKKLTYSQINSNLDYYVKKILTVDAKYEIERSKESLIKELGIDSSATTETIINAYINFYFDEYKKQQVYGLKKEFSTKFIYKVSTNGNDFIMTRYFDAIKNLADFPSGIKIYDTSEVKKSEYVSVSFYSLGTLRINIENIKSYSSKEYQFLFGPDDNSGSPITLKESSRKGFVENGEELLVPYKISNNQSGLTNSNDLVVSFTINNNDFDFSISAEESPFNQILTEKK